MLPQRQIKWVLLPAWWGLGVFRNTSSKQLITRIVIFELTAKTFPHETQ
jgi:hypothetical protein